MESYVCNLSLPNGAKRYIKGNKVTQDVLKKLIEPDGNLEKRDLERTVEFSKDGQVLSSLTRLRDYGVILGNKKDSNSLTIWSVKHQYVEALRAIIYGEK